MFQPLSENKILKSLCIKNNNQKFTCALSSHAYYLQVWNTTKYWIEIIL